MHFPIYIPIGFARVHPHFLFETLAYFMGFRFYLWLRKQQNDPISTSDRLSIFIGACAGGLLGSHLLGFLESPEHWVDWRNLANKTVVGGLLGGLIGVEWTKKIIGVTVSSGDMMTYPLIVGQLIGRIGCTLTGVSDGTWGAPSTLSWAFDAGDGILRHPTPLYEVLFLAAMAVGLWGLERRFILTDGSRFRLYLAGYLFFRFWIEYIKPVYVWPIGFSTIQVACLAGLLYYRRIFWKPQQIFQKHRTKKCEK
ncbi:MAG: prolipoprotein diacylglyceryl transferase [Bacteroidetes Order II. Incertae sedis bacterium]|nr:prolipoprotein diacylglyceryl transferase [Bacteroidetes Order II. bacterium]